MSETKDSKLIEWLFANAGPIIRWRLVNDFALPLPGKEADALRQAVLDDKEVQRWLANLGGHTVHGSRDSDAENAMAKLVEYGLRAGIPEFDEKMLPYADRADPVADAYLVAAGYSRPSRRRLAFPMQTGATFKIRRIAGATTSTSPVRRPRKLPKPGGGSSSTVQSSVRIHCHRVRISTPWRTGLRIR